MENQGPLQSDIESPPVIPVPSEDLPDPWCNPNSPVTLQFEDITSAAFKIKSSIRYTPCMRLPMQKINCILLNLTYPFMTKELENIFNTIVMAASTEQDDATSLISMTVCNWNTVISSLEVPSHLSDISGMDIYLKKEFMQYTGSFKERGACYALMMLPEEQKKKGVVAASLGNHSQGVSYHGKNLNIPVTVVMPPTAPIMKVQACHKLGANVVVQGKDMGEAKRIALQLGKDKGLAFINGYDHPHVLAGQGTIGLEILEQLEDVDAVIVPIGGGGLLAGVAVAIKTLSPKTAVIGVESEKCPGFSNAMKNGKPTYTPIEATLADGLAVPVVGYNVYATAASLIDKVVVVKEEWIAIAILRHIELDKCVVEGAGASCLAAVLSGSVDEFKGKRVVLVLSGGNIDTTLLGRCLERGMAVDGRLLKFSVAVNDRPGGVAELCRLIASIGVSIKDIIHERAWLQSDIFSIEVNVVCETRNMEHATALKELLNSNYKHVNFCDITSPTLDPEV